MSKIRKILISLGVFIVATFTKISNLISGADDLSSTPILYGPPASPRQTTPTVGETILKLSKPIILAVMFIIGLLVVILNKKISKKVKVVAVSSLIILAILVYIIISY